MTEESRQLKKQLEQKLRTIIKRIRKLEDDKHELMAQIYALKGKCYACAGLDEYVQHTCEKVVD
jgi:hypothetical protein